MRVEAFTDLNPPLNQLVKRFTNNNNDKTLDVILKDSRHLLQEPSLLPPPPSRWTTGRRERTRITRGCSVSPGIM